MIILRLILIVLTIFCTAKTTFAAQESGVGNIITTKITANFIDIKRKSEMVNLIGNVIVEKEDLSIKADNMVVYYYENKGDQDDQGGKIKRIEAANNVKIFNGDITATGKYGFYNPDQNNLILEKNVIFNNGTSVAKGQKFIYDLKTKKGNLVGKKDVPTINKTSNSDGRVVVIIDDNDFKKPNPNSNKK
jgi:lipopolysaccharide transport protein LptA